MAISASAKSNHDQLFGDRASTLAQSDPELIEYFGNFAFGEVAADAARLDETLDLHTRLMVQLAAILAVGGLAEFRVVAAAAVANGGVSPLELRIMQEAENSLRRLKTDYIDLYQVHRPSATTDVEETLGALTDLVHQGKVRYIGSSSYSAS